MKCCCLGTETTSNHVIDVNRELGIEAARVTIMREIHTTMESHGTITSHLFFPLICFEY